MKSSSKPHGGEYVVENRRQLAILAAVAGSAAARARVMSALARHASTFSSSVASSKSTAPCRSRTTLGIGRAHAPIKAASVAQKCRAALVAPLGNNRRGPHRTVQRSTGRRDELLRSHNRDIPLETSASGDVEGFAGRKPSAAGRSRLFSIEARLLSARPRGSGRSWARPLAAVWDNPRSVAEAPIVPNRTPIWMCAVARASGSASASRAAASAPCIAPGRSSRHASRGRLMASAPSRAGAAPGPPLRGRQQWASATSIASAFSPCCRRAVACAATAWPDRRAVEPVVSRRRPGRLLASLRRAGVEGRRGGREVERAWSAGSSVRASAVSSRRCASVGHRRPGPGRPRAPGSPGPGPASAVRRRRRAGRSIASSRCLATTCARSPAGSSSGARYVGRREVPRLAVAPRQRVVGDLAHDRLDEAVLPALGAEPVGRAAGSPCAPGTRAPPSRPSGSAAERDQPLAGERQRRARWRRDDPLLLGGQRVEPGRDQRLQGRRGADRVEVEVRTPSAGT